MPGRSRARADQPGAQPITVEQLLARQGGPATGRRRAVRRGEEPGRDEAPARLRAPDVPPSGTRGGMPPVPGAGPAPAAPPPAPAPPVSSATTTPPAGRRPGLPPVPDGRARPSVPVPPLPRAGAAVTFPPADVEPGVRPSRPVAPLPPIPGKRPAPPGPEERPPPGFAHRARRSATATRGRRRLTRAVLVIVAVVALVGLYHLGLYFYVDRSIGRVDALATDGAEVLAPQLQADTETYVVVGYDVPGQEGPASVATLVASVSEEEQRAVLVSIPPTAYVDTPACRTSDGSLRPPTSEAFASSLLDGGPACLVRAVQQLSGLRVDHYLAVDLSQLPGMVDALDGISVCVPGSAASAAAAEPLPAGQHQLTGADAAAFLRPGDAGSDVTGAAVAERAQVVLTATLGGAMSTGTLLNTVTLTRFLSRAADALTVDEATTLGDLRGLAGTLGELPDGSVQGAGLPVSLVGYVPVGSEQAYVLLDGAGTRSIFDAVIERTTLPEEYTAAPPAADGAPAEASPAAGPSASAEAAVPPAPAGPEPLTAAPGTVTVDVLNGTGTAGLAAEVGDQLRAQGFGVGAVGNEPGTVNETLVRYGPAALERARTVAAAVPGAVLQASDSTGDAVQLVLGPNFSTVVPVTVPDPAAAVPAPETSAAETTAAPTPEPTAPACS
ncbi:LytR C-terminal domain-containing protein [Blastococcus sp. SYSU D00669]